MNVHDLTDKERLQLLGEVFMDELRVIREYLEDIPGMKRDIATLKIDVSQLKSDMVIVKAVLKDHSKEHKEHRTAIQHLQLNTA